jgi:hypothetical protein
MKMLGQWNLVFVMLQLMEPGFRYVAIDCLYNNNNSHAVVPRLELRTYELSAWSKSVCNRFKVEIVDFHKFESLL